MQLHVIFLILIVPTYTIDIKPPYVIYTDLTQCKIKSDSVCENGLKI